MQTTLEIKRITPDEVKKKIGSGEHIVFIDTRSPVAWNESNVKIAGAIRMHYRQLEEQFDQFPRNATIVTYCT